MNSFVYLKVYLKRIFYLLGIYTVSRLCLFLNNIDSFSDISFFDFLEGIRFDFSALVYINIPILILLVFPTNFRCKKGYQRFVNILFYSVNIPFIILNNVDIEYFRFTQKRSTLDFFQLLLLGEDAKNIIPQYMKDYWSITLLTIVQIWLLLKIKDLPTDRILLKTKTIVNSFFVLILGVGFFIVGARGGLQLKPIKPINAGELYGSNNCSLILNTPFCIFHSFDSQQLKPKNYFIEEELDSIYTPLHHHKERVFQKKNVIILIMESLSREFIGFYNEGKSYTPFLDSLMRHSLVFENAYSNGLKSIEALPAITASIPSLMDNPFITSSYAQNNFESLASLLNKEDYRTSFFHGGLRGTMGFYSFSRKAGFQEYYGLEEFNNLDDFDGSWGIYDNPFMQFFVNHLNEDEEPFFSTLFTLSSHPPYTLPADFQHDFEKIGIRETISYTDYAMSEFFKKAKKQKWYNSTLFVITADHSTPISYNKKYKNKIGRYAIPMIIFHGDNSMQGRENKIVQQIDIMPTILELLGYNKPFLAFGKSMLGKESWAINYLQNRYCFITPNAIMINKKEEYKSYSDWKLQKLNSAEFQEDILLLKALKQSYNQRMINNKITYEN